MSVRNEGLFWQKGDRQYMSA